MESERKTETLSLLQSCTDEELNFIIRKIGGSSQNKTRTEKENDLIKNFNSRIIENIILAFIPTVKKREVFID